MAKGFERKEIGSRDGGGRRPDFQREERVRSGRIMKLGEAVFARSSYEAKLLLGEGDFKAIKKQVAERLKLAKRPKKRKTSISFDSIERLRLRARSITKDKIPDAAQRRLNFRALEVADLQQQMDVHRAEILAVVQKQRINIAKADEFNVAMARFRAIVPENFEHCKKEKQLQIAEAVATQNNLDEGPEAVRAVLLDFEKQESDVQMLEHSLQNDAFLDAYLKNVSDGNGSEKAFVEAVSESPELQEEFRQYERTWRSENVSDVFLPPVAGASVEPFTGTFDAASVETPGATFEMGADNRGAVEFGNNRYEVAVFAVDGRPQLFIFDENADRGVVGPLEPKSDVVARELGNREIDGFFSKKFREYVTADSEKDPTKIPDVSLMKISARLLPDIAGKTAEQLDPRERRVIENLARLFVTPDSKVGSNYIAIEEKVRFFDRKIGDDDFRERCSALLSAPLPSYSFDEFAEKTI